MLRIAFALALLGVLAGSAHAGTPLRRETASSGNVKATVAYRQIDATHYAVKLTIVKDGKTTYNKAVPTAFAHTGPSQPLGLVGGASTLELGDLDGDGVAEVLVNFYTGGAHCCNWTWAYHFNAKKLVWSRTAHIWGDPLYTMADLAHTNSLQLISADDRFAYAFSSYADSVLPVQVWVFKNGRFTDATRTYGNQVSLDLEKNWHHFKSAQPGTALRPILAAWVADNCLAGGCNAAYATVQSLASKLNGPADKSDGSVQSFLTKLKSSLMTWGYWK
ncbi:MAG TPA: hypothetical protein VFW85_03005 [Gaiellaceae bacterium]|nr:hypothetical protein [Gaiellaceae bacterium]